MLKVVPLKVVLVERTIEEVPIGVTIDCGSRSGGDSNSAICSTSDFYGNSFCKTGS